MKDKHRYGTDLEKRIALLVDLLVHIQTECKTVEDDPSQMFQRSFDAYFYGKARDRPFDDSS